MQSASERRLLFKDVKSPEGGAEKPKDGGDKPKDKEREKAKDTVEKEKGKTADAVKAVVPEAECPLPQAPRAEPQYLPLPSVSDGLRHTRNALMTAIGVALPPVGIAGLAVGGTARYLKSKTTDKPLSVGTALKDTFIGAPKEGLKSVWKALTFPVRLGGAAGINTLKFAGDKLYRGFDATVCEVYRDARAAINHRFNFPPGTNLLSAAMIGVKRTLLFPKDFVRWYAAMFKAHPKTTLAATIAIPWITMHNAWPAVIKWGADMSTGILNIIQGIASKLVVPPHP